MSNDILHNALITGGSGMVGSNITFGYKPTSSEMNICDKSSISTYISQLSNISCIIHLAATNLRESEENPKKAIDVNINGTTNMLFFAKQLNIPFVFISTGAVFSSDNYNLQFDENFKSCPNSMYGYTKDSGEKIALLYEKTILIRTGWLFGGNQKTHFKFVETTINNLLTNNKIYASNNFYGSPTYVLDFIEQMKQVIIQFKYGIHHIVNDDIGSGYDIAIKIAEVIDSCKSYQPSNSITTRNSSDLIMSVTSSNIPNSGPQRSKTEVLTTIHNDNKMRSWKIAISEYIEKYISSHHSDFEMNDKTIPLQNNTNKKWSNRIKCRLCNKPNLHVFFQLQNTPPANHFTKQNIYQEEIPLEIAICNDCKHFQLIQIVDPVYQYSDYFYVSSTSNTMTNHLKNSVIEFTQNLNINNDDNILEIGANDGVCIEHLINNGFKNVVGIDPASNINKRHNLPIICDFFGSNILPLMKEKYNSFKLIYAFHCCAHIENIQDIFETIYNLLDANGTFIMEVGYFYEVFKNNLFDTIYHEHIDYHTCFAMQQFSKKHGLLLYNVKTNDIQGGSIQLYFCKDENNINVNQNVIDLIQKEKEIDFYNYSTLYNWKNKIIMCGIDIHYLLNSFVSYGKKIAGYGASAKSTTFMYQYKLTKHIIDYVIDDSIYKQHYLTPGLHIPIKPIQQLNIDKIDYIIILSWNFAEEILEKLKKYRDNGLRVIIPFPEIRII